MKKLTLFILLFVAVPLVFSQTNKIAGMHNSEMISNPGPNPKVTEVIKNLRAARLGNDAGAVSYWENKLRELTHPQIINASPEALRFTRGNGETINNSEATNFTRITNSLIVANSISREGLHGEIYAAVGFFGSPTSPDTLKIFRSVNNGLNFTLVGSVAESDLKITNNGLDIEAVSKGDSSYAYVAMNYTLGGNKSSALIRVRQDGLQFNVYGLFGDASRKYTLGRITSDNSVFFSSPYIYFSVTLDSTVSGTRRLKSKLFSLQNIFANNTFLMTGYQDAVNGQYGYYVAGAAPDSAKFESDIAFVNTEGDQDQLYTITVVRGIPGLFGSGSTLCFTRSVDLGITVPALFTTADAGYYKENPRIATTGFLNNSLMVCVRRLYGGGDWDPYSFYTTNVTTGTPAFVGDYVNSTTDTTIGVSVAGRIKSNGSYLFAFNNRLNGPNDSKIYTRPFSNGIIGTQVQSNPVNITGTNFYGNPDAGFRNINNDSCLVIWGGTVGIGSYVTGGCTGGTFTGIGSSTVKADDYHLSQNYPNPFNPSTIINYSLPVQSNVLIKIFDVLGKEVAYIVNETQSAGLHSIEFNGVNLTSGVYYYRIEANDFADTKKMLLIK